MDDINSGLSNAQEQSSLFGRDAPQISVTDWLLQQAEPEERPVSLDTLKDAEIEKIMASVCDGIDVANKYYEGTVEPKLIHRQRLRYGEQKLYKEKLPNLSRKSKFVSMDLANVIEWMKPSLVEVFTGNESPVTIAGSTIQNDDTATKIQQLIEYQLMRKNNYTSMVSDVVDEALSTNLGVTKIWWKREENRTRYKLMYDVNDMQQAMMLTQASLSGEIEIKSIKPLKDAPDLYEVQFDHVKVTSNHPVVEYVPPTELRFTPEGSNLQSCKFVAHRKIVKGDYLKRKELDGTYQNVDKALDDAGDTRYTNADEYVNPARNQGGMKPTDHDKASKDVELYECYVDVDYNNDGVYEHLIVHCVGNVPLSIQVNEFDLAPFFALGSVRESRKIFADHALAEQVEGLQDLKTALIRQIIINVAKNNDQQKFIDYSKVTDIDALMNGDEYVPINGDPSAAIANPPPANLSPLSMDLVNYAESELQNRTGSTKYNQGLDSNSLNSTATGITAILGQADKRIRLIARLFAENWIVPMIRFLILLNRKYGEDVQTFRFKDSEVSISSNDLDIDYDLVINVGNGAGTKEARIQSYMMLLSNVYPTLSQAGVATPKSYYAAGTALLEEMGLKNTQGILLDPDSPEAQQIQQQAAQQQQAQEAAKEQADLQKQLIIKQADYEGKVAVASIPSVRANMNDLPLNTQVGIINSRTAGNATIDDLINKVAHDDSLQVPNQPQGPIPEQLQQLQQGMNNGQT
ncbi:portal protein [Megasphaera massiliensis]|jgi:hypothetical protein|uniref:portal protein n=1 Tax=Megasphaera massiliensis TaxID=1232428 RepID=UPI0004237033|nr:hypothetical protein [Megasphaera massiliensis]MCQ5211170.1 hypothetical protein [Megasphaera massiliensis]DAF68381.1 MAG TPA: Portal protein [Caudoviricetes sp.]